MHNSWRWPTNMYVYISFTAQMFRYLTRSHGGRGRMMARLGGRRRAGDRRAHTRRRPRRPQHCTAGWRERHKDQVREREAQEETTEGWQEQACAYTYEHARLVQTRKQMCALHSPYVPGRWMLPDMRLASEEVVSSWKLRMVPNILWHEQSVRGGESDTVCRSFNWVPRKQRAVCERMYCCTFMHTREHMAQHLPHIV